MSFAATDRCFVAFLVTQELRLQTLELPVRPNHSLKLTRYGMRCKPGPRYSVHFREPGLQRMPARSA